MLKLLLRILKDQKGILPLVAGAAIAGGSTLLGSLLGKNKKDEEVYDPYAGLRGDWQTWLQGKLGTKTPYTQNPAFDVAQPAVESAAEKSILGYFNKPTSNVSDYSAATKKYSEASKASMAETYADEMNKTKDMYNRLGLVSSTPGLTAQGDVAESQRTAQNLFDSQLMYQNLDRTLAAQGLDVSQLQGMLGSASTMGAAQTGRQEYSQQASMADIQRMIDEEMGYGSQAAGVLGGNPPERTVSYTPNIWSNLATSGQNIGQMLMLSGLLGKK